MTEDRPTTEWAQVLVQWAMARDARIVSALYRAVLPHPSREAFLDHAMDASQLLIATIDAAPVRFGILNRSCFDHVLLALLVVHPDSQGRRCHHGRASRRGDLPVREALHLHQCVEHDNATPVRKRGSGALRLLRIRPGGLRHRRRAQDRRRDVCTTRRPSVAPEVPGRPGMLEGGRRGMMLLRPGYRIRGGTSRRPWIHRRAIPSN